MEASVVATIITAGAMLMAAAMGYFIKMVTGESRASVRKVYSDAISNDAGASNSYMEAARKAAQMVSELQIQVKDLTSRVEKLEDEKSVLQGQVDGFVLEVAKLRDENKAYRVLLGKMDKER